MRNTGIAVMLTIIVAFATFTGCATSQAKSQFQIREFQTRSFETTDVKAVLKAIINVLQDEGYVIKQANLELGFINATKEHEVGLKFSELLFRPRGEWSSNTIIETTCNVSQYGEICRVRANFQIKTLNRAGGVNKVKQHDSEEFYIDFFAKVSKGIFINVDQGL